MIKDSFNFARVKDKERHLNFCHWTRYDAMEELEEEIGSLCKAKWEEVSSR